MFSSCIKVHIKETKQEVNKKGNYCSPIFFANKKIAREREVSIDT